MARGAYRVGVMISAIRVFGRSIGDTWYQLIGYATCNLVVFIGCLLVLPGPPLLLGLTQVATESSRYNERPEVGALLRAAWEQFFRAWQLYLIHIAGLAVIGLSFYFYIAIRAAWALPLVLLTASMLWAWVGMFLFSGALLVRSERGALIAVRNGLVLFFHYPLFSTTLVVLVSVLLISSILIAPLMLLVTISLVVVLSTRATTWALRQEGILPPETPPQEEPMNLG